MNIVILGPQGSGKGTQAELLSKKYGLSHIETGRICREISESNQPLSKKIKKILLEGKLVSDDILKVIIKENLEKPSKNGFILDGTPRDVEQYNLIKEIFDLRGSKIDKVIVLNISEEETIKRLSKRRTCEVCGKIYNIDTNPSPNGSRCVCGGRLIQRDDDKPSSIKRRLQTYHEQTSEVIRLAKSNGILEEVNGERPIYEIFKDIVARIEKDKTLHPL